MRQVFCKFVACFITFSCLAASAQEKLYQAAHNAMGTTYAISLYARDARSAQDTFDAAFDEIDRVDDLLSNYKPTSELSRINREADAHEVITDPEWRHVEVPCVGTESRWRRERVCAV